MGAGPAGWAAAIDLARLGHSVVVVDKAVPTQSFRAESLPPVVASSLQKLGVWERFASARHLPAGGICCAWGQSGLYFNDFLLDPYHAGWHIDRREFDSLLGVVAQEAGVQICRGQVFDGKRSRDQWCVIVRSESEQRLLRSKFLVLAHGRGVSPIQVSQRRRVLDQLVGVSAFFQPDTASPTDSYGLLEATATGWFYSAPCPGNKVAVTYYTDADLYARGKRRNPLFWSSELQLTCSTKERVQRVSAQNSLRVFSAFTSYRAAVAGDGWAFVGDAGFSIDPLSSLGVYFALESGQQAAAATSEFLLGHRTGLGALNEWSASRLIAVLKRRIQYYREEERWKASPFWKRRQS